MLGLNLNPLSEQVLLSSVVLCSRYFDKKIGKGLRTPAIFMFIFQLFLFVFIDLLTMD